MVMDDFMITSHVLMEEDLFTLKNWPLEAQNLPQIVQQITHYAKTSPLEGMTSSLRACFFCKSKL